jgi:exodeoxyribonuclease-3
VGGVLRAERRGAGSALIRVISFNCNGIRAAARKGFYAWLLRVDPDIVCLQETKAQEHQLPFDALEFMSYFTIYADAERRGYSGVAIYARRPPERSHAGLGWPEYDREGRYVQIDYGSLSFASIYVPSGSAGIERQRWKDGFLQRFEVWLAQTVRDGRSYILCGDYNIAHRDIDIYKPTRAQQLSGFLPHERAWMDRVVDRDGWVDAFRVVRPEPQLYTYWSNFEQAFEKNNGWRIDYHLVTPDLRGAVRNAYVYTEERFSDHAPVVVEYDLTV